MPMLSGSFQTTTPNTIANSRMLIDQADSLFMLALTDNKTCAASVQKHLSILMVGTRKSARKQQLIEAVWAPSDNNVRQQAVLFLSRRDETETKT